MPKGSTPRKQVSKTRAVSGGAQQWVRGKTTVDRVTKAGDAVRNTRNPKAQQMLLRAQKAEMSPGARAVSSQRAEMEKLARGRASINKKIEGPNVAAKSAYNRIRLK